MVQIAVSKINQTAWLIKTLGEDATDKIRKNSITKIIASTADEINVLALMFILVFKK